MSPILKRYLTSYLLWAKAKAAGESTDGMPPYSPYVGLCCNVLGYVMHTNDPDFMMEKLPEWWQHGWESGDILQVMAYTIREEMECIFIDDGLCTAFPFGYEEYHDGIDRGNQHTQPRRLAWLESKVGA